MGNLRFPVRIAVVAFLVLNLVDLLQTVYFMEYESNPLIAQYPWLCLPLKFLLFPLALYIARSSEMKTFETVKLAAIAVLDLIYFFSVIRNMNVIFEILKV